MQRSVNMPSLASCALVAGLGAVTLWAIPPAWGGEIRIEGGDCAPAVHLVARDAPLSDVLSRLAKALDFKLSYESDNDPLVSVAATLQPIDLVSRLAPAENVSLTQARNPRCPQRERIVKVWVLSKGQGSVMGAAPTPTNARQALEAAEQARRERAGADMILNAHGMQTTSGAPAESQ